MSDPREPSVPPERRLTADVVHAGAWMAGTLISSRLIGMLRLVVLARLLEPRIFGLGALGFAVALFLEAVSETGAPIAVLQAGERAPRLLDAAWTLRVLRGAAVALAMAALAPAVGAFLGSADVVPVVTAMALIPLLEGSLNIGLIEARRRFDYRPTALAENGAALTDLLVSVGLALRGAGVWALVAGWVCASAVRVALSFVHPYRPRPCFEAERLRELVGFGRWVAASTFAGWLLVHGLGVLVARVLGLEALGLLQVAWRLAVQPLQELEQVLAVTIAAFAELRPNAERLALAALRLLRTLALPVVAAAALLAVHAPEIVGLLLGERWAAAVPLVRALALAGIGKGLLSAATPVLQGLGRPRLRAQAAGIEIVLLVLALAVLLASRGLAGVAVASAIAALGAAAWAWWRLAGLTGSDRRSLAGALLGPLLACAPFALVRGLAGRPASSGEAAVAVGISLALLAVTLLLLRRLGLYRPPAVPGLRRRGADGAGAASR